MSRCIGHWFPTGYLALVLLAACGTPDSEDDFESGGTPSAGGEVPSGGTGAAPSGGAGTASAGSGGTGSTNATGGLPSTGGVVTLTGGTANTGGLPSTGGSAGTTGGLPGTGGGPPATGGAPPTGGAGTTGGVPATGGAGPMGGTAGNGGAAGSGGTVSGAPYKGVANSPANEIAALGATWCYNWTTAPQSTDCDDPYFVPMIWGAGDVAGAIQAIGNAGYDTVLGFNEPNKSDQANMTVEQAIALWPDMTSDPNIRVGSPAVSDDGRAWLVEFMDAVQANDLRVDFIAMHWYGWNAGSCVPGQLEGAVNWASQWGLPVWITEFGCMGSSNPDEQTLLTFFDGAVAMLDNHPEVERYAWYPWNTYSHLYLPDDNDVRVMTALGEAFAAAPQYR